MRTTHIKSNVVNNGVPKLPTSDAIYYGEIAINYGASGETLSIKNSNDEIVPFSSDKAINKAFEVHAQSLIDLDGRIVELKDTKVESEEFNKIVSDLNQKLSVASESLDNLYNEIVNLTDKINENEVVISESLCDLDKRIKKIDNSYNNPTLTAITFNSITWVTDIPSKGGTATKDNCTFEVYAKYDNGTSVDISSIVTVEGTLVVPSSTAEQRHEAGQLILTASYSGFTATGNVTAYQEAVPDPSMEPLTFNILSAGTINWTASNTAAAKAINYKLNDGEWTSITSNTGSSAPSITVTNGDKIQFRGNNAQYATSSYYNSFSGSTALFEAEGNIMSLIYGDEFKNNSTISSTYTFNGLFRDCAKLVSAENLILPATTLTDSCYYYMFSGCKSLTTAPAVPATTLAQGCYEKMFYGCTSLTTAPALPATTLANYCYYQMFRNCTSLNYIKCLATNISASDCTLNWVIGVSSTGTFVKASSMTSWTTGTSGVPTGWTVEDNQEPLTFNILSAGTINWTASDASIAKTIDYKVNNGEWASITSNTDSSAPKINVAEGDKLQFRGNNAQYATGTSAYNSFSGSTALFEAEGNIMSLIYGDDFKNNLTINDYAFTGLFRDCVNLVSAENLALPAINLAESCYANMFNGCTSLTTAPELPESILANYCYANMFAGCESLTAAPALPATALAHGCYQNMFYGCTSLTTAPALPATTLATDCYGNMFDSCTSLTTAPELPATDLVDYCYFQMFMGCSNLNYIECLATDISAPACTGSWVDGVASTGTFVKASSMDGWTVDADGIPEGWEPIDA